MAMLVIRERIVDKKKHTVGYNIEGKVVSRSEAVRLAQRGWLFNAKVSNNKGVPYIVGSHQPLYCLPERPRRKGD